MNYRSACDVLENSAVQFRPKQSLMAYFSDWQETNNQPKVLLKSTKVNKTQACGCG